jgi:hypothetical protein
MLSPDVRRRFLLGGLAITLFAGPAAGQVPLTPGALGMGGAYVATARGFESIFYNPANLGLANTPKWSVAFPQITAGASVLGPDVTDLPDFLDYDNLSQARRQELLGEIPASGTSFDLDVRAPVFALQVGNFGVGVAYGLMGEHTVGRDLVELFFEGFEEGRFDYSLGDTRGERVTFWDFTAGYGRQVGPVSVGVAGHYYLGRSLVQARAFGPRIDPLGRTIEVDYASVASEGASGFGLDLGAAMHPIPGLTLSAAVANLVSSFEWDDELVGRQITLTEQDFEDSEFILLEDRFGQSEQNIGANPTGMFGQVATGLFDNRDFPTTLRLGAAYSPIPAAEIGVAYQSQFGEGLLMGNWDQLLGAGVQVKVPLVTLRLGASTNLAEGNILGAGLRLGALDLGIARFKTAGVLDEDADRDGLVGSFSVNVRTRGTLR